MSITTSLSFTFVNTYASQSARPAATAAAERPAQAEQTHSHSCGESRPASRQNRLVEAMMSALQELGIGGQAAPAAAATTGSTAATANTAADATAALAAGQASAAAAVADSAATTATDTVAATDAAASPTATTEAAAQPAVSLESAVRQFAHELFSALRQIGRGESSSEQGSGRVDGDGGRRHHHGHHGWRREGYGDMSQRLDALSQTFAAPSAVAAGQTPVSSSISITLTIQNGEAQSPAEQVTTNGAAAEAAVMPETVEPVATDSANAADAASTTPASTAAATTEQEVAARNPLLDAFSQLFGVLKPQAAQTDMADKLRSFLQSLAQSMRPDSMHSAPMPQVGALVNVTA